jgi:peptidyl-prolyl cis-trans isomerase SurA
MNYKNLNKFQIFLFIIILFLPKNSTSIENKILFKIDNEIITSVDVDNEINYLTALNPDLQKLNEVQIFGIAKNSLIREKIKKIEILKNRNNLNVDEKIKDQLIEKMYLRLNLKSKSEFQVYVDRYNLKIDDINKKLLVEALWNNLIYKKFSQKVRLDKEELKKRIEKEANEKIKYYLLSEIVFNLTKNKKLSQKFDEIKKSIKEKGFRNTVSIFSTSSSSETGGELGWVKESLLSSKIKNEISKVKIGNISNPIVIPGGFLILKIDDIKEIKEKIDIDKELENLIRSEINKQLNQYSNIYYNRVKTDIMINEK